MDLRSLTPIAAFAAVLVTGAATGCLAGPAGNHDEMSLDTEMSTDAELSSGSAETVARLLQRGFSPDDIEIEVRDETVIENGVAVERPAQELVILQGDVAFSVNPLPSLLDTPETASDDGPVVKQWRKQTIVSSRYDSICLLYTNSFVGSPYEQGLFASTRLTLNQSLGLWDAALDYNALNTRIEMIIRPLDFFFSLAIWDDTGCTSAIWVRRDTQLPASVPGRVSGFPNANGVPPAYLLVNSNTDSSAVAKLSHVLKHELGHALGFVHSDWNDRNRACPLPPPAPFRPPPKSEGHTDAVKVPGTDDWTIDSVMAACIPANPSGDFMGDDEEAIETVY